MSVASDSCLRRKGIENAKKGMNLFSSLLTYMAFMW